VRAEHKWMHELMQQWIAGIDDETLLTAWGAAIKQRVEQLTRERTLPMETLIAGLRESKRGDDLYPAKRVRFRDGELREVVYFHSYQPRAKRLWVCPTRECTGRDAIAIQGDSLHFYQITRTSLAVRRRAMKIAANHHHKGA
jgi:hypothetical protein